MLDKTLAAVDNASSTSMVFSKVKEGQLVASIASQVYKAPVEKTRFIYTVAVTAIDVGPNFDTMDLFVEKTLSKITIIIKIGGSQVYSGCPKP
jgi:hypothetical protein